MMRACILGFFFLQALHIQLLAQTVQADFTLPATACLGEKIFVQNNSTGSAKYEWDLCQGDLTNSPLGSSPGSVTGSLVPTGMDVVFDGSAWYGFVASRNNNSIYRVSFDSNFGAISSIVNLGDGGSVLVRPVDIKIVSDNGQWYGFVFNEHPNLICRLDFGSSLTNTPTATVVQTGSTIANQGFDIIKSNNIWYIVYTSISKVGIIRLTTIQATPSASDIMFTPNLSGSVPPSLGDIKILKSSNNFFAYTPSYSTNQLYRLDFGTDIFSLPAESDLSSLLPVSNEFYGIDGDYDKGNFYLFLTGPQGNIIRANLGSDLSQQPLAGQNLGSLGFFQSIVKIRLIKNGTDWYAFSMDYNTGNLYKAAFPSPTCQNNPGLLTSQNIDVQFSSAGSKYISLRSSNGGAFDEAHKRITLSSLNAPVIDFINQQICLQNPIQFVYTSDQSIASQTWDFGDSQTSSSITPQNTYAATGSYAIKLNVLSSLNGCRNRLEKNTKVYDKPSSSFTLPTGLICTNNEFTFTNNTVDYFDGNLTYEWYVDNNLEATTRDLKYSFLIGGNQAIKLKATIPGCSDELTQVMNNIQSGPMVGFDYTGKCENELVQFTNTSSGDISGYVWNLGNTQTSTAINIAQVYSTAGNYQVSLQTTGTNGCISTTSEDLIIYSKPQPNFSLDLPPFSCAGTSSKFNDLTPNPTDSNISLWSWSFGDAANGMSTIKNPTYTYGLAGSYDVSLKATTNFGCEATKSKTIQIADPPKAGFATSAACLNQPTYFTDGSSGTNKSWLWKIGNSAYTLQSLAHVFSNTGNYTAQLTVTGNNNCISILSKSINVPVPPVMNFSVQNNCATQNAIFEDLTAQNIDPAISRVWDFGGKGIGTGASPQFSFSTPGTYNVKLTATNQSGCSYALAKNISITPPPVADFLSSIESGPPPLAVKFTNTSANATNYQWRFNDPSNTISLLESPLYTYASVGDFIVDLTARNVQGCVDTKSKIIRVIIPRTEIELEEFKLLMNATTGSVRTVVTIKNNSNYTINDLDVVLDIAGNALIKEKINTVILPNASSSQILNYELLQGRSKLDYLCVEVQLPDDSNLMNNSACISLESVEVFFPPYPNPVRDQLSFDWVASVQGSVKISIISQMGQLAFQKEVNNVGVGLNQMVMDLTKLNPGFYILIFESQESKKTFPIIIQN